MGGDSNNALERYTREARHRPLTNVNSLDLRLPKMFKGECMDITFTEDESRWVHHPHNDAWLVAIQIGCKSVHRVFVDNGSSVNISYYNTYKKLGLPDKDMVSENAWIYGFSREAVKVMSATKLPVTLGEGTLSGTQMMEFMVLDQESAHNAFIWHPLLKKMKVVTSIYHLTMKFPTPHGVGTVRGSQHDSGERYHKAIKGCRRQRDGGRALRGNSSKGIMNAIPGEAQAHYFVKRTEENVPTLRARPHGLRVEEAFVSNDFQENNSRGD